MTRGGSGGGDVRGRGWTHETGHISFDHSLHPRFSYPVEGGWRREGWVEGGIPSCTLAPQGSMHDCP